MTPRLGFLGLGWIGRDRLEAIAASGAATVAAVADVDAVLAAEVAAAHGSEALSPDELLSSYQGLDGLVIATPSALHAEQATAALESGTAVFCQKPLARNAGECGAVIDTARRLDRLLGVDLSYRHLAALQPVRRMLDDGALGEVYAADLVFHNAYGPDKPWFTDPALSGGGCVIDLGIHLVDLVLHLLDRPKVDAITSRLYARGRLLDPDPSVVEDYATALLDLSNGSTVSLTCSWFLHAGLDAEIALVLHGTHGSVSVHNVDGSFYDFASHHRTRTTSRLLAGPPDAWGGRAAVAWAERLADDPGFDPEVADMVAVAEILDGIYRR
jgi:predicted dehydrogenase